MPLVVAAVIQGMRVVGVCCNTAASTSSGGYLDSTRVLHCTTAPLPSLLPVPPLPPPRPKGSPRNPSIVSGEVHGFCGEVNLPLLGG